MVRLNHSSQEIRRARTRSLIQLGALVETAGLLETFEISLGTDLQKDPEAKLPVAALFKGLLELNRMVQSGDFYIPLMGEQGLAAFGELKRKP
jgi:hypothetical protein